MKKFVSLLLALMMALSLVACGSKADTTTDDKTDDDTMTEPANALEKIKADGVLTSSVEFSQLSIFFMASSPAPERSRRFRPPSYHPPHSPSRAESRGLSVRAVPGFAFTPAGRGRCRIPGR